MMAKQQPINLKTNRLMNAEQKALLKKITSSRLFSMCLKFVIVVLVLSGLFGAARIYGNNENLERSKHVSENRRANYPNKGYIELTPISAITRGLERDLLFENSIASVIIVLIWNRIRRNKRTKAPQTLPPNYRTNNPHAFAFHTTKDYILLSNPFRGILVCGGAGSGKTHSLFKPIIEQVFSVGFAGILYDYKYPELTNLLPQNPTIPVKVVNLANPHASARVNPLAPRYIKSTAHAEEYAGIMVANLLPESIKKPDFWSRSATALLQSGIIYLRDTAPDRCSIPGLVALITKNPTVLLTELRQWEPSRACIQSILTAMDSGSDNQLAGVVGTLQLALNRLNNEAVNYIFSGDDIELGLNNPLKPTFLVIGADNEVQSAYSPAISLTIAVAAKMMNTAGEKHPSVIIMDEAPTLYIPHLEQIPATGRSRMIGLVFGCQDVSQVVDAYGQDKARSLLANLGNQFFGRTTSRETAEHVVQLFGRELVESVTVSTGRSGSASGFSGNKGVSKTLVERAAIQVKDILAFSPGQFACIVADGTRGIFVRQLK